MNGPPSKYPTPLPLMSAPTLSSQARPLLQLELEASAFAADWRHCDQIANYVARLMSFDRADPFLYSNLLSTVLNELVEIVFFRHQSQGRLRCRFTRDGAVDRIEFEIPVETYHRDFYERAVTHAQSAMVGELYTRSLLGELPPDRGIGFLELAADYGAQIWMEMLPEGRSLRLVIDVRLDELTPVSAQS